MSSSTLLLADKGLAERQRTTPTQPRFRLLRVLEKVAMALLVAVAAVLLAVIVGPRFFPYQALIVRSGSMSPTIPTGSIVFYKHEAAQDVHVGQVILFAEPDNPSDRITHRVYRIVHSATGTYFVTKGDANAVPDAWKVQADGVGWVAEFHVPLIGYPFAYLSSQWARLALLSIPAIALGLLILIEQFRLGGREKKAAVP